MRDRTLRLDGYNISAWRYRELRALCRQYDEMKKSAAELMTKQTGAASPPRSNSVGDPVLAAVQRREKLVHKIGMIERAARESGGGGWFFALIQNCCRGIAFEKIPGEKKPTCSRNAYFRVRREFFYRLAEIDTHGAIET